MHVGLVQRAHLKEAHVLKGHGVARGAVVQNRRFFASPLPSSQKVTIFSISSFVVMPVEMWTSPEYSSRRPSASPSAGSKGCWP